MVVNAKIIQGYCITVADKNTNGTKITNSFCAGLFQNVFSITSCVSVSIIIIPSSVPFSCPANKPLLFQADDFPTLSKLSQYPTQFAINIVIAYLLAITGKVLTAFSMPLADLATLAI